MNASETGYKVSLIGDASVGKTSIISRYTDNSFELGNTATVGVSNITAEISYNGQKVPINAWDTAGQERFRSLIPLYTRDSAVVLLVFSMDSLSSFESLDEWYSKLRNDFKIECPILLVANKIDVEEPHVTNQKAEEWANNHECKLFYTSAKDGTNIDLLFQSIADTILRNKQFLPSREGIAIYAQDCNDDNEEKKGCC